MYAGGRGQVPERQPTKRGLGVDPPEKALKMPQSHGRSRACLYRSYDAQHQCSVVHSGGRATITKGSSAEIVRRSPPEGAAGPARIDADKPTTRPCYKTFSFSILEKELSFPHNLSMVLSTIWTGTLCWCDRVEIWYSVDTDTLAYLEFEVKPNSSPSFGR
ncbi:hypothetical protein EVAR_58177_1, partial [Eumeta japonica]